MTTLAVVVPCFNEEEVIRETASRLTALIQEYTSDGLIDDRSRIYFVDDGSQDATWSVIEELSRSNQVICGIKLSRNRGHQHALLAGLLMAEGDALISVDADLQDDLNVMRQMLSHFHDGAEIVYGVREERSTDTWFKRTTAELYYKVVAAMGVQIVFNHADYRLLSRRAIDALASYREVNLFLRGIIPQLGFRSATVTYSRGERFAGTSKYPVSRMVSLAIHGVTSFTAAPLRAITGLGMLVCVGSFAMVLWAIAFRLFTSDALPGWASTVVPIYFLGGVQLLCLGVIGEYLAKIYVEIKARPRFFLEKLVGDGFASGVMATTSAASHRSAHRAEVSSANTTEDS